MFSSTDCRHGVSLSTMAEITRPQADSSADLRNVARVAVQGLTGRDFQRESAASAFGVAPKGKCSDRLIARTVNVSASL